jgi:IS1 family transposase
MNRLSIAERASVIGSLVEGNSINSTVRMTGISKPTILKLLADLGPACAAYHNEYVRNLSTKRLQCDEIWAFCYAKQKNVPEDKRGVFGYGDVWTWTALDADSKLMVSYMLGDRTVAAGQEFLGDAASRINGRIQITTDGHASYGLHVGDAFKWDIDYTMLQKIYGPDKGGAGRYSPAVCKGIRKIPICGNPDPKHISTSFVERQNLTMRMHMRRFTRLTNGFSKKVENHQHNVDIFFFYYNFCRVHSTTKTTPAMAAGLSTKAWTIEDMIGLIV